MRNTSKLKFTLPCFTVVFFVVVISCQKSSSIQSVTTVNFKYSGDTAEPIILQLYGTSNDSASITIVSNEIATNPITGTVTLYSNGIDSFNNVEKNWDSAFIPYKELLADMYTLPNNGNITIPAGAQSVTYTIYFAGDKIDFTQHYALSLMLANVQGANITPGLSIAILPLNVHNSLEGTYIATGYFVKPPAGDLLNLSTDIVALSATTCEAQVADLSGWKFSFNINPETNKLDNFVGRDSLDAYGPDGSGFLYQDNLWGWQSEIYPGSPYVSITYNNTYDPATKTFWMHYGYNGGASVYSREIYEEFQKQ